MADARPHLHIVDADTGSVLDEHPEIQGLRDHVRGLERDVATWHRRYHELHRDKEHDARESQLWPVALRVWRAWQLATGHTKATFNYERFALIEPHLKRKGYGPDICLRAVAGISYDHFTALRKNGSRRHFNEWERCFKDIASVEERANAAPAGWRELDPFDRALMSLEPWLKPNGKRS